MNNDLEKLKEHVDARLDRIEDKLDNHLERLSAAETSISWLSGQTKLIISVGISAIGSMALILLNYIKL